MGNLSPFLKIANFTQKSVEELFCIEEEHFGRRKRLLVYFLAIASFFSVLYIGVSYIHEMSIIRYGMLVDIAIFLFLLWLLYKQVQVTIVAQFFILVCWLTCLLLILVSGGIRSAVMSWLTLIPVSALLLIGRGSAWIWAIITCLLILGFSIVDIQATPLPFLVQTTTIFFVMPVLLGIILLLTWVNQIFDKQQENLMVALESSNCQLKASEEELRQNIEELVSIQESLILREKEILSNKKKLEEYSLILMGLAKSPRIQNGLLVEAMQEICYTAASGLQTSRVSIWLLRPDPLRIVCVKLYERATNAFSEGVELFQSDYPAYFNAILHEQILCANEAQNDPATSNFSDSYLQPLGIFSMLDIPFFLDGKLAGVLCCEHCDEVRNWSGQDKIFVKSLADIITLGYKAAERKAYIREIQDQHDEIASMNLYLEERVKERTLELEKQNAQLTEYAFINSHMLRAPLSRILGLINLFKDPVITLSHEEIIAYIKQSGEELDGITRKINDALDSGKHFNRQDFGN
ncbi:MAG: GAF domain-containing protein [Cyclobacteriaceae bacterium]|nr:GAF domain-containing protein [Cyclobacteriaceae bacterium]